MDTIQALFNRFYLYGLLLEGTSDRCNRFNQYKHCLEFHNDRTTGKIAARMIAVIGQMENTMLAVIADV